MYRHNHEKALKGLKGTWLYPHLGRLHNSSRSFIRTGSLPSSSHVRESPEELLLLQEGGTWLLSSQDPECAVICFLLFKLKNVLGCVKVVVQLCMELAFPQTLRKQPPGQAASPVSCSIMGMTPVNRTWLFHESHLLQNAFLLHLLRKYMVLKSNAFLEFPGGPVVRTFTAKGAGSIPGRGTNISQNMRHSQK